MAEPKEATSEAPAETRPEPVHEAPSLICVIDEATGKLVTLLGWTLEDFEELEAQAKAQKQSDEPPRHILLSISATGTAKAGYAELTIRFNVWTRDERWTRVPLRLEQALLLSEPVAYKGGGECFLHLDTGGEGHVAWIRGGADKQHELTLRVWVPLSTVGDETRLWLSAPGDTSSELKLTVPLAGAVGEVPERVNLSTASPEKGKTTEFSARWTGGDLELKWHKPLARPGASRPVLDAEGVVLAKIDRRSVMADVRLKVRGVGGAFDRFRVAIPKAAELIPGTVPGYTITPKVGAEESLVEVRRDKKLADPMEIRFTIRLSREASGAAGWFELGGVEVIDAVQQRGYVAVATVGEWQVRCIPDRGVRQIDQLPDELKEEFEKENVVARFEYFGQPFSLAARVLEIKTRVRVEPESQYRIQVTEDRVWLNADLRYKVLGAKVFALDVAFPGWQLEEVGPGDLVGEPEVSPETSGPVSIPLLQPSVGEIAVSVRAYREIPPDTSLLSFELPRPQADLPGLVEVKVAPDDNVELAPRPKELVGLVRQQVAQPRELSYRAETTEALFVADFKVRSRHVGVDVASEVVLVPGQETVRQKFSYEIAYERLDKFTLDIPESLAAMEDLEIVLDSGERLSPTAVAGQDSAPGASRLTRTEVVLPTARLGKCELEIRYPIQIEEAPSEGRVLRSVPLVMPGEGELSSNELSVSTPRGLSVHGPTGEGPWRISAADSRRAPQPTGLSLSADERTNEVILTVHQEESDAIVVDRAWVQTSLTDGIWRERAVFRFTSNRKEVVLVLPTGVDFRRLRLTLASGSADNRKPIEIDQPGESRLLVPLPDDAGRQPQWLEARYVYSGAPSRPGRVSMELPRLEGEVWVRRMYWELVLPSNEHVVVGPEGFTAEYEWGWNRSFWGRRPAMDPWQLEEWSGAEQLNDMSESVSRYLFSRPGPADRGELRTANRWLIVLAASSAVLLGGLLLIYVPASRHPAGLLVVALVLVGASISYPGPALLTCQAASLGLALALLGALLHRALGRSRGTVGAREPSSSILDRHSTQAQYRQPVEAEQASTETVPLEMSMPHPDSAHDR